MVPAIESLISGRYIPLELWEAACGAGLGPRGGVALTWEATRALGNSLFVSLLSDGWVGSSGAASTNISKVVEDALKGRRSVLLAEASGGRERKSGSGPMVPCAR